MLKLETYKRPDSYIGNTYEDWLTFPVMLTRDSGALETSNFYAAWKHLSGTAYNSTTYFDEDDPNNKVIITRSNHWACGWVEFILIRVSAKNKIAVAQEMLGYLEGYPVLDEDLYYSLRVELGEVDDDDEGDNDE